MVLGKYLLGSGAAAHARTASLLALPLGWASGRGGWAVWTPSLARLAMDSSALVCILAIMLGCGVNVVFLELITSRDPASGGLITVAQFLFVAVLTLPSCFEWKGRGAFPSVAPRRIPIWVHLAMTVIFFSVSLMNNVALKYGISMPMHLIFRSSSLAASLLIGMVLFRKSYRTTQIRGVMLVSLGILLTVWADANTKRPSGPKGCCDETPLVEHNEAEKDDESFHNWVFGLALLSVGLVASAALGHLQESAYERFGKASTEMKFYSHTFALPYFYILWRDDIMDRIAEWRSSETLSGALSFPVPVFGDVPILWLFLLGNVISQMLCVSAVYRLTAVSSSLTCTMTLTVRKFMSIIVSVVYFRNPFSPLHWCGTILVFSGVLLYSGLMPGSTLQGVALSNGKQKEA